MEAPPSYSPPKKKMSTCLIVVIICAVLGLLCCGGGGAFFYFLFNKGKDMVACGQGFEDLQNSVFDYTEAHGGKLPKATTWMDDIRPYYAKRLGKKKDEAKVLNFMPAQGTFQCSRGGSSTAIVYNVDLSGKALKAIKDPEGTIMLFESSVAPAPNIAQKYEPLPDTTSPEIMGKHVGWFRAPVSGSVELGRATYKSGINGNMKFEKTESEPPAPSK